MIGKTILVTGGSGYLGSALVKKLSERFFVYSVDRVEGEDVGDLKKKFVQMFDCVVHLAAETDVLYCQTHPVKTMVENSAKTINLISMLRPEQHFVFTSTSAIYGDAKGTFVNWENENPNTYYAKSKLFAEKYITRDNSAIIRLATLWGKSVVPCRHSFISQSFQEMQLKRIARVYDPKTKRPYMNVGDAVDRIVSIIEENKIGCVNLGTETIDKITVIEHLAHLSGVEVVEAVETKLVQDFVMYTTDNGKRFLDSTLEDF